MLINAIEAFIRIMMEVLSFVGMFLVAMLGLVQMLVNIAASIMLPSLIIVLIMMLI